MNNKKNIFISVFAGSLLIQSPVPAQSQEPESVRLARAGYKGMVVADDAQAAEWGAEILRKGGNAIDAAVATAFAMSVTRPHYAALGGGGFLIFCSAPIANKPSDCKVVDFREKAPAAAQRDMFVRNGKADSSLSQNGALASGIPGVPAGLLFALEKYGTQSRRNLLARPIRMAREGIRVGTQTEIAARSRWDAMNSEARRLLSCGHEATGPCRAGEKLRQPDLAKVLEAIAKSGESGFYGGDIARKIVEGIRAAGGILTTVDLENYKPSERLPVRGEYKGYEVVTMPPPSSGGTVLVQLLEYMKRAEKSGEFKNGFASLPALHAEIHAMSLAFADRAEYLGDPDFFSVPLKNLLAEDYLNSRWKSFDPTKAKLPPGPGAIPREPQHTTHFSAIDSFGNAVSITETVNENFGSGFVPPGTGVVMNNQMDDFSAQPGVPNLFGLVGGEANSIAPGKRPLSSMSPTIVRDQEGNVRLVLGAAGGPRIITSVFQTLVNRLQFGMSLIDAVSAPRIHHQWKPQVLRFERNGIPFETQEKLKAMGYALEASSGLAVVHALERFPDGRVVGAPDPRGEGMTVAE